MRLFGPQIRAARVLLGWSQSELASSAAVGTATIQRLEAQDGVLQGTSKTIWKVQAVLENAGISFIDADESNGPGVRFSKPIPPDL